MCTISGQEEPASIFSKIQEHLQKGIERSPQVQAKVPELCSRHSQRHRWKGEYYTNSTSNSSLKIISRDLDEKRSYLHLNQLVDFELNLLLVFKKH